MDKLDLNINNYDYGDILKLFEIEINYGENEMKKAKTKVLSIHPDKSGLDKEYFLFFSSAYKILYNVYNFKNNVKKDRNILLHTDVEYLAEKDESQEEIINSLKNKNKWNPEEFNGWFNKLFDKVKVGNDFDEHGYGNWLSSSNDENDNIEKVQNTQELNDAIHKKKTILRKNQICKYGVINEFNNSSYCDLTNSQPENYSSGLFSSLQYEDLKKAHVESVVPVTDEDFKQNYNSYDDIKFKRQSQNTTPLSRQEASALLDKTHNADDCMSSHRAFKLIKQEEQMNEANNKFWSYLKQLK
jgi:hypothetical protein